MAWTGKKDGVVVVLGDVPASVLADPAFRAQFDEIRPDADEARKLCAAHIERHYPTYKQLNTLRVGTEEEKSTMGAFIDACRTWSNGANPDPTKLAEITP